MCSTVCRSVTEKIVSLTQYGQHCVVLKHLHRARAHKVDGLQRVALTDEELSGCAEGGLNDQRERAQTPAAGRLEKRQLQQLFVQVHGDVCSQLIREVLQQLEGSAERKQRP